MVTHNNLHLTKLALESIKAQQPPVDCLVIDNASDDGTPQYLSTGKTLYTICHTKQQSLSACWNQGLKACYAAGYTQVLVVNNDVELLPLTHSALQFMNLPFVSAVSVDNRAQLITPTGPWSFSTRPHPDFSCFMIRRDAFEIVGPFNEAYYPAYGEDAEWHIRAHRAGVECVCIDVPFLHHGAQTVKNCDDAARILIQRGADNNRAMFKATYGAEIGSPEYYELFKR